MTSKKANPKLVKVLNKGFVTLSKKSAKPIAKKDDKDLKLSSDDNKNSN